MHAYMYIREGSRRIEANVVFSGPGQRNLFCPVPTSHTDNNERNETYAQAQAQARYFQIELSVKVYYEVTKMQRLFQIVV